MKSFWDNRYRTEKFVYGKAPNDFFKSELDKRKAGKLLLPGEGEGRNAVYAASEGWIVDAFDQSRVASEKALSFAAEKGVHIDYQVSGWEEYPFKHNYYDAVGLICFHLGSSERTLLHSQVCNTLKPGGLVILEAFHTSQLGNSTGGPGSLEMLFNEEGLLSDFASLDQKKIYQTQVILNEGPFHQGIAEVVRFIGKKH